MNDKSKAIESDGRLTVHGMITRVLVFVIILIGALMALPILKLHDEMVAGREEHIEEHALFLATSISETLTNRSISAQHLASISEVKDLMEFADRERVENWSVSTRRFYPQSIGLGLVDPEGNLLGNKNKLRLGPACDRDTNLYLENKLKTMPPVHITNPDPHLHHFDMMKKIVSDEGQYLGLLLISFDIDILREALQRYAEEGYRYELVNSAGVEIANFGQTDGNYEVVKALDSSDWILRVRADNAISAENRMVLVFAAVAVVAIMLILAYGIGPYISRQVVADLDRVRTLISYKNLEGKNRDLSGEGIRFKEVAGLLDDINQLSSDVTQTRSMLELEANTDILTGMLNRRGFELSRERLYKLALRQAVTLVIMDIDYFKYINDTFGHQTGDVALRTLGKLIKQSVRSGDEIYRLGGDEVLVVFSSDNMERVQQWYDDLAREFAVAMGDVEEIGEDENPFTLSAGATLINTAVDASFSEAMVRADGALYRAKDQGRAQLVIT